MLSPPDDYLDEADFFHRVMVEAGLPAAPTLLELGSGGGNNAAHLKAWFAGVTLTDLSPQMLAVGRALNPDCEHLVGICVSCGSGGPSTWSSFTTPSTT